MNRLTPIVLAALTIGLAACNTEPEEAEGSSNDSVAAQETETGDEDEVVSEGPSDDATPYSGTTGDLGGRGETGIAGSGESGSNAMQSGGSTEGQRPPKGSKVQRAD
ncbi:MAG: hypothetical protein QNJ15_03845 [Erythrobacter sp.]|nr:hypothetical protein [Erythrobacter sp.]